MFREKSATVGVADRLVTAGGGLSSKMNAAPKATTEETKQVMTIG